MDQKSFCEGGRAFGLWSSMLLDRALYNGDTDADGLVSLLTPVIKGFLTDRGFELASAAQQVYGGHGYIEEWGMSQFVRDARIAMIYEGANGIQALDLVGRKLASDGGKPIMAFFDMIKASSRRTRARPALKDDFLEPLKAASKDLQAAAMYFMAEGAKNPQNALAGSYDFMTMMGHVCLGFMWARMAKVSRGRAGGRGRRPRLPRDQARHRALLHGPPAAGDGAAPGPDQLRRRAGDGARGRELLKWRRRGARPSRAAEETPMPKRLRLTRRFPSR